MGQVLHGSARTTEAVRRAIQHSQASLRALAKRYGINQKTVRKWKARDCVVDLRTGPTDTLDMRERYRLLRRGAARSCRKPMKDHSAGGPVRLAPCRSRSGSSRMARW